MVKENKLLKRANAYFINRDYDSAFFIYGQLLAQHPKSEEYKLYVIFCDIATENELKAISLFDYFKVSKGDNLQKAIAEVKDIIAVYDGNLVEKEDELKGVENDIDLLNAIRYEDFKRLIEDRGSFRIAFEDIMFSTKVAIESKEDFFDFVTHLIDNNFSAIAYNYLDGFNDYFVDDKELKELYKKLEDKQLDNKHK